MESKKKIPRRELILSRCDVDDGKYIYDDYRVKIKNQFVAFRETILKHYRGVATAATSAFQRLNIIFQSHYNTADGPT